MAHPMALSRAGRFSLFPAAAPASAKSPNSSSEESNENAPLPNEAAGTRFDRQAGTGAAGGGGSTGGAGGAGGAGRTGSEREISPRISPPRGSRSPSVTKPSAGRGCGAADSRSRPPACAGSDTTGGPATAGVMCSQSERSAVAAGSETVEPPAAEDAGPAAWAGWVADSGEAPPEGVPPEVVRSAEPGAGATRQVASSDWLWLQGLGGPGAQSAAGAGGVAGVATAGGGRAISGSSASSVSPPSSPKRSKGRGADLNKRGRA